ncbi:hypothetical protein Q8A67_008414 [Cirrhinus molitorella]|uniref:TRIM8/14/16/25/29/45/65 coiled-coil region domain-containing protein n=1 Tax=Cirrhinus molitorella TaxID=172907 RepID=A0AA88TUG6_9TELE|nr:hypothetical protein Q8A67_008414 [Cirrhinus molitorella]
MDEHKNHDTVPAAAQRTEKQEQLKETQKTFQQRIQQREKDLQQLRETVESHKSFQCLSAPPESTADPLISLLTSNGLKESVQQLKDKLEDFCKEELKKISDKVTSTNIVLWTKNDFLQSAAQRTEKRKQLKETQKTFQQRIQQREKDLQQLREALVSHKRSAQTAVEDSERIFTELIHSIKRSRSELIRLIRDQEKAAVSRAEGRLERLEQEISDLRRRDAELEQLSHTQDHIQFLQSFQSLSAPPESTDANEDHFSSLLFSDDGSVHQLRDKLEDFCKEKLKKISDRVTFTNIILWTRIDFLKYSHQLTLDPNTKQLKKKQKMFQQRIQQKEKDLQQLREAVESHKRSAQTAVEDIESIFTELIHSIERSLKTASFQSPLAPPESTDGNDDDGLRESVRQPRDKMGDFYKEELKKIPDRATFTNIVPRTRNDFLQYSHQLTLDPNTVNKRFSLSENNRVVTNTGKEQPTQRGATTIRAGREPGIGEDGVSLVAKGDLEEQESSLVKEQLKETQKMFQQRIHQKEKDLQQLRETVESHKRSAQTAVEDSERIFTELIRSIERSRSELIRLIRDQEKAAVSRAEGRLERLEQEINDLRRRDAELEQLSHTQDHIQFLQVTEI